MDSHHLYLAGSTILQRILLNACPDMILYPLHHLPYKPCPLVSCTEHIVFASIYCIVLQTSAPPTAASSGSRLPALSEESQSYGLAK